MVIEYFGMGSKLVLAQICVAALILLVIPLALIRSERLNLPRGQMVLGDIAGVIGGFGTAFGAVLGGKGFALCDGAGMDMDGGTAAYQRMIGATIAGGAVLLLVKHNSPQSSVVFSSLGDKWRRAWPWVLANAVAGQALGVSFFQLALKTAPTGVVLPIVAMTPLVVIPFSRFFDNERPSFRAILGSVIAVAGVVGLILCR